MASYQLKDNILTDCIVTDCIRDFKINSDINIYAWYIPPYVQITFF